MFRRPLFILTAFAIVSHWAVAFAQIDVAESYDPGQKIAPRFAGEPLEGATAVYTWSHAGIDPANVETVDGGRRLLIWAPSRPEPYELTCEAVYTLSVMTPDPADPTKGKATTWTLPPYSYSASFLVTGSPEPGPTPVVKTLAQLAGDKAPALAAFYLEFARITPLLSTSETLRAAHEQGLKLKGLDDTGAKTEIARRFDQVVPLEATTLTDELRSSIDALLASVAAELGASPPVDPSTVTAATYVYEKDDGPVPGVVTVALNRLNREKKIIATLFEKDTRDGDEQVPDQYKVALAAATEAGLPAFIVQAGEKVLRVVKSPATEQQLMEAVP